MVTPSLINLLHDNRVQAQFNSNLTTMRFVQLFYGKFLFFKRYKGYEINIFKKQDGFVQLSDLLLVFSFLVQH